MQGFHKEWHHLISWLWGGMMSSSRKFEIQSIFHQCSPATWGWSLHHHGLQGLQQGVDIYQPSEFECVFREVWRESRGYSSTKNINRCLLIEIHISALWASWYPMVSSDLLWWTWHTHGIPMDSWIPWKCLNIRSISSGLSMFTWWFTPGIVLSWVRATPNGRLRTLPP